MTDHRTPQTPVQWLIEMFETTNPDHIEVYDRDADEWTRPHCIQPMFQLKGDQNTAHPMHVIEDDYCDSKRRWL
jgi:hypothetical protein